MFCAVVGGEEGVCKVVVEGVVDVKVFISSFSFVVDIFVRAG